MKTGDIIFFRGSDGHNQHFFLIIEDDVTKLGEFYKSTGNSYRSLKYFSSYEGTIKENTFTLSRLKHLAEGFWEYHS